MVSYDKLREDGYVQYVVLIRSGTYEDSSFATLVFYYMMEKEKTPTEIADAFKTAFQEYAARCHEDQYAVAKSKKQLFEELFRLDMHELGMEFEQFLIHRFDNRPHFRIPIKKIVTLDGMEDYCTEQTGWLFNEGRHADGSVTSEVFEKFDIDCPQR